MTATAGQAATAYRSFSQIKQVRTCSWQYKLARIDRAPRRPSVPAVAGSAIHSGTEVIDQLGPEIDTAYPKALQVALVFLESEIEAQGNDGWAPEDWKKYGRRTIEKPNGEDVEWFREVGIPNALRAYQAWRLGAPDLVIADVPGFGPGIEVPFHYYIGDQLVVGFIDRIFTSQTIGGYFPLDIKSGRKPETDEQLGLYGAALHKALGWNIEWGYYLYALKTGTAKLTAPIMLSHWTDEKLRQVYEPANKLIEYGLFIPHPGASCMHCDVAESCEFARAVI